jgi:hypothetical protein
MVHYPFAQHIFSSNNNQINENHDDEISNGFEEMSNDVVGNDLKPHRPRHSHEAMKNKYSLKFKRNAPVNPMMIEACCSNPPQDACKIHHCH